ncbi:MAG: ATP-binding protein [Spirochaetes bacterium]|nr:ATP-binding protein [Spirochaetota bacterium]MBU0955693.1 ATP-binding protein [Spirochaetota bacterium]
MSKPEDHESGKLKIGDNWNAITIIALSQNNPLKAIAEFVENSIDAGARNVTIVRGKHKNEHYIKIIDDGKGISDFKYVATHIGDSIKRQLKKQGATGLQGEFGIGLLSFWTVGESCTLTSAGEDGITRTMRMAKGNPSYSIREAGTLFAKQGTELLISPILAGVRVLSGEKIQNFLASELRDRISKSGVRIRILDHSSRRELIVEPRKFKGRLLHQLPEINCPFGEVYLELYFAEPSQESSISLCKQGTRVVADISRLENFAAAPWNTRKIEGIIDVPFLQLTPGTRDGVIQDEAFESLCIALEPLQQHLEQLLAEQKRAEEEETSRNILNRVTKALREAFLHLPSEDYSWLAAKTPDPRRSGNETGGSASAGSGSGDTAGAAESADGDPDQAAAATEAAESDTSFGEYLPESPPEDRGQKSFFEYAGPLHKVMISPASSLVGIGDKRKLKAVARDRSGRQIDDGIDFSWSIMDGGGQLQGVDSAYVEYSAPDEPCVVSLELKARQGDNELTATALITVTAELIRRSEGGSAARRGLPGYTYQKAPGQLWRSRYDLVKSVIVVNNAHADFIFASRQPMTKLRYILRLFAKELVLANFPEIDKEELLERMVELSLYTEENLK